MNKNLTKLLITNDDGITAPGIIALLHQLVQTNRFEIMVSAPAHEKSGFAHSITINTSVGTEPFQYEDDRLAGVLAYKVYGTPADCVKLTVNQLMGDWVPDLVISGINKGINSGLCVLASGTCGAASEATVQGFKSIALSLDNEHWESQWHFANAAALAMPVIDYILGKERIPRTYFNINLPNIDNINACKGTVLTKQDSGEWDENYTATEEKDGITYYKITGVFNIEEQNMEYDSYATRQNYVSVTPLSIFNCPARIHDLDWLQDWTIFTEL
eukprot:TRINITY_DN7700_c0_g1_i1.p1 TRINITY_DN7700_c0_g1~~TRINITY_DN7700_c0_g1_i1.p1  ORF type:complete len:287 (-),score=47.15 TRINITY_DN7700_c0_g1_i1:64-882(-)